MNKVNLTTIFVRTNMSPKKYYIDWYDEKLYINKWDLLVMVILYITMLVTYSHLIETLFQQLIISSHGLLQ